MLLDVVGEALEVQVLVLVLIPLGGLRLSLIAQFPDLALCGTHEAHRISESETNIPSKN